MEGLLHPECYWSRAIFDREGERIFRRLWIFACLKQAVAAEDCFVTRELGGRQVVVQNMGGRIRAFENVCAHRGKLIQREFMGTRPLVCGYHGWRYAADGGVQTIPFEDTCYRFALEERKGLRLREFSVCMVGSLIFINLGDDPIPIEQQFSAKLVGDIVSASGSFDSEFLVARWRRRFNWKLAYENLRDMVHPRFVHTQTLALYATFPTQPSDSAAQAADESVPDLVELSYGGAEGEIKRVRPPAFSEWTSRWGNVDAYFNWLMFPNTHLLTSDGGHSFSLEHHHPVAPDETEITAYYFTARRQRTVPWVAPTLWEMAKGAKRVLDEDTDAMEEVQRGLGPFARRVRQGVYELQNKRTDRWYIEHVLAGMPVGSP